jgi:hypothetical protein
MFTAVEPVDIEERLADPKTYEDTILRIFTKRNERGAGFSEAHNGVSYFSTAAERQSLAKAIARSVTDGEFRPRPVDLWILETNGKRREAHLADFPDHVVGSALFKLLTHNARCYGLPGVYSCRHSPPSSAPTATGSASKGRRCTSCNPISKSTGTIFRSVVTRPCGAS